jgi:hypothetical protein
VIEDAGNLSVSDVPLNIQEFNAISGLIFAQLYNAFPRIEDVERQRIASAMGVEGNDWSRHILPSGRSFSEMLSYTIGWLNSEDYIKSHGSFPGERVSLTTKGLAAMNAVPSGLKGNIGVQLIKAVAQTPASGLNLSGIGDLVGGIFGGFTKSISG